MEWAIIVSTGSAICAGIALIVNATAVSNANRSLQLQMFDRAYADIARLDEKLQDAIAANRGKEILSAWRSQFLNRLEYFACLVNGEYLQDQRLVSFFSGAIIRWYEEIFEKLAMPQERADPDTYPELKSLYAKLKQQS